MTFDWIDLADGLRWLLLAAGAGWIFMAWLRRLDYRLAVLGLALLWVVDGGAHALATWVVTSDSGLPTEISSYSAFVLLAGALGLAAASWQARRGGLGMTVLLDAALLAIAAGVLGARGYYLLTHAEYYRLNPACLLDFAQGGMGLRGGLALGLAALALAARLGRVSFWKLGDAGAVGLALALSVGWYGAGLIGANYGGVSDAPFAQDLPDRYGILAPRWPVQMAAAAAFLLLFMALVWLGTAPRRPGLLLLFFLLFFGLVNFGLDGMRADETLLWNGWRIDQGVDLVLAGLGLLGLARLPSTLHLARGELTP